MAVKMRIYLPLITILFGILVSYYGMIYSYIASINTMNIESAHLHCQSKCVVIHNLISL